MVVDNYEPHDFVNLFRPEGEDGVIRGSFTAYAPSWGEACITALVHFFLKVENMGYDVPWEKLRLR